MKIKKDKSIRTIHLVYSSVLLILEVGGGGEIIQKYSFKLYFTNFIFMSSFMKYIFVDL